MNTPLVRNRSLNDPIDNQGAFLDAFQTGRLTRTIEIPYYEQQRRTLQFQATWLGSLFEKKHGLRIYDIDLQEDWVLIENTSKVSVMMGAFSLCDEDRYIPSLSSE